MIRVSRAVEVSNFGPRRDLLKAGHRAFNNSSWIIKLSQNGSIQHRLRHSTEVIIARLGDELLPLQESMNQDADPSAGSIAIRATQRRCLNIARQR